jgi:hypothetical protein
MMPCRGTHQQLVRWIPLHVRVGLAQSVQPFVAVDDVKLFSAPSEALGDFLERARVFWVEDMVNGCFGGVGGRDDLDDGPTGEVDG